MLAEIFMVRLETRRRQAISQEGSSHGNSGQEFWRGRSNSGEMSISDVTAVILVICYLTWFGLWLHSDKW